MCLRCCYGPPGVPLVTVDHDPKLTKDVFRPSPKDVGSYLIRFGDTTGPRTGRCSRQPPCPPCQLQRGLGSGRLG